MFAVGMLGSYFHLFGGAVDIIVVQQADGTFKSSPWYVQFGMFQGVLKGREKIVDISVNDVPVDFHMYLDHYGEAYFEKETRADEDTIQSPPSAPSSGDEMGEDGSIRLLAYSKTETGDGLELLEAKNSEAGVEALTVSYNSENLISGITDHRNIEKANSDSAVWVSDDLVNQTRTDIATSISETMLEGERGIVNGSKGMQKREKTRSERLEKAASEPSSSIYGLSFEETGRQISGGSSSSEHGGSHLAPGDFKSGLSLEVAENAADRIDGRWRTSEEEIFLTPTLEGQTPPIAACISSKEPQLQERGSLAHCTEGVVTNEASSRQLDSHLKDVGNTASLTGDKCVPVHIEEEIRKFPQGGFSQQPARLSPGDVESPLHQGLHGLDSFGSGSIVELDDEYIKEDIFKSCLALEELHINTENDPGGPELEACDSDFEVVHAGKILSSYDAADLYESEQPSVNMDRSIIRGRSEPVAVPWVEDEQRGDLTSSASLPARFYEGGSAGFEQIYSQSVGSSPRSNIPQLHVQSDSTVICGGDLNGNIRLVDVQAADPAMYGSQKDSKEIARVSDAGKSSSVEVEISLCRHLLSEGMGAEAAAMAFTSQKVCFEEFERSGPAIIANDKLVVKIGENYFSWVEAAPYILGMAAFGNKLANNIKGGIAVEAVCLTEGAGSQIGTLGSSATGWNLWPFSFMRSRVERSPSAASTLSTQALVADTDVALESPLTEEFLLKNRYYKQLRKSKERTYVPTSAQLASLKLRDGPNKITFTFTTRVLGKTQVDARIHLWKWNTRIVISDVDGTITK